jgi:hypothetical protein
VDAASDVIDITVSLKEKVKINYGTTTDYYGTSKKCDYGARSEI